MNPEGVPRGRVSGFWNSLLVSPRGVQACILTSRGFPCNGQPPRSTPPPYRKHIPPRTKNQPHSFKKKHTGPRAKRFSIPVCNNRSSLTFASPHPPPPPPPPPRPPHKPRANSNARVVRFQTCLEFKFRAGHFHTPAPPRQLHVHQGK